jgi:hypothetical protein
VVGALPQRGRIGDVAGIAAVVHLQHDGEQAVGELLGGSLDAQAQQHVVGQVGVVLDLHVPDRPALRLHPRRGAGHRVGHGVEQPPDPDLGLRGVDPVEGTRLRQPAYGVGVVAGERARLPGVAGLADPDPAGRHELERQHRGAAEQPHRGVCVVGAERAAEHRDRASHREPHHPVARAARATGELDLAVAWRVRHGQGRRTLQRHEAHGGEGSAATRQATSVGNAVAVE